MCYSMPLQNELSQRPGIGLKLKVIYHRSKILPLAITFGHTICIIVQLFTLNDNFDFLVELKNKNKSIILLNENERAKDIQSTQNKLQNKTNPSSLAQTV